MSSTFTPADYGAVADGTLHTLSEKFGNLKQAQRFFPFVSSIDESIDRVALQQCLNLAQSGSPFHFGRTVAIPPGNYFIDQTLTLQATYGLNLIGAGFGSVLLWYGAATAGPLKIISCEDCVFQDFCVKAPGGTSPAWGFWLTNTNQGTDGLVSTNNHFEHIKVTGQFARAWQLLPDTGGDNNNDLHTWNRCSADQYRESGIYINGGQCHFLRIERSNFAPVSSTGTAGIRSDYGGFFHVEECIFNACENNVQTNQFFTGPITITKCNSEGSRRFLAFAWNTGHAGPLPVELSYCRGAMIPQPGDYIIDLNNEGLTTIKGNTLYTTNSVQPLVGVRFGCQALEHIGNIYQTGSGGPKWNTTNPTAVQVLPTDATGYSIKSLTDRDNTYQN